MHIEIQRIVVPTDFSDSAQHALRYAAALAQQFGSEVHVLHVIEDVHAAVTHPDFSAHGEFAQAYFNRLEEEAIAAGERSPRDEAEPDKAALDYLGKLEHGVQEHFDTLSEEQWWQEDKVKRAIRYGNPVEQICRYAHKLKIDLLILGTHGRRGLTRLLLGSVAERVVRMSPCPAMVVRSQEERDFVLHD